MTELSSILGCRAFNVHAYLALLKLASTCDKSITDIQNVLGWAQPTVSEKVGLMRKRGFVKIEFRGRYRIVCLTMEGRGILDMRDV